ncbi:MAG: hypothetical protein K2G33_08180 [Duncaniella sp.]|nr:hypothetical protein [Duncaniella sp.]
MLPLPLLPLIILAAMTTVSCHDNREKATPKPQAYHRISIPDSVYISYNTGTADLMVNADAVIADSIRQDGRWIDISYPHFPGAKIFLTLTSTTPSALPALIENRTERIRLNTSSATTEVTELTSVGGWSGTLFMTRNSLTTPLQILAYNPDHTGLLSGALYISPSPSATPDSIAPIVSAVSHDLLTTLKNLK